MTCRAPAPGGELERHRLWERRSWSGTLPVSTAHALRMRP